MVDLGRIVQGVSEEANDDGTARGGVGVTGGRPPPPTLATIPTYSACEEEEEGEARIVSWRRASRLEMA